jgi:hypothetical protein
MSGQHKWWLTRLSVTAITDRGTLTRIARKLAIPSHVLGVAEPDEGDFASMLEFGASVVRLAEVARRSGRAAEAVNELWPLIAGLETRIAAGHAERQVLVLLTQARAAFGIALGHLLPDEQLATGARWTGKALRIAQRVGNQQLLAYVLRMHGNELRKAGHPAAGAMRLQHALEISDRRAEHGSALVLLARAAAEAGHKDLFDDAIRQCLRLLDIEPGQDALFTRFTVREARLRGLLATGRTTAAATLAARPPGGAEPPTPLWRVIERITTANVLASSGDAGTAAGMLTTAISDAETLRLPHQVQRVIRRPGIRPALQARQFANKRSARFPGSACS